MIHKHSQRGFSIVEAVIVVAVVGIIATGGLLIYRHDQTKPTGATGGTNTTQQTPNQNKNQQADTTSSLAIKEWGVHLTLNKATTGLYYYINPSLPDAAYVSIKAISDVAPNCAADKISLGAISRLTEARQQDATAHPSITNQPGTIHIGSYWYGVDTSHASCTDGTTAMNMAVSSAAPDYSPSALLDTLNTLASDSSN